MAITKNEEIKSKLEQGVISANNACGKIAAHMVKSLSDAAYQIRWLQDIYVTIEFGRICELALTDGLAATLERTEARLSVWTPERSSSPFANACSLEAYDAMRRFIAAFRHFTK